MSASNGRLASPSRTGGLTKGLGWIYAFRSEDGAKVKLGYSTNPEERIRSLSTTEALEWFLAIPGSKSQEQALHRHFRKQHIRRETFAFRDELEVWLRHLHRQHYVAKRPAEMETAYAPPNWLPWEEPGLPTDGEQLLLEINGHSWERTRKRMSLDIPRSVQTLRSDCDDWYTPPLYIEYAREVMGGIDLDPACSPKANIHVRATNIFTARDNGLLHDWHGRVWLNPPYGGLQQKFIAHLLEQHEVGNTSQAVACLNAHAIETLWFQPLWRFPICFTHHRITFKGPNGEGGQNTGGTAFVYLGENVAGFAKVFSELGAVVTSCVLPTTTREEFQRDYDPWLGMS